MTKNQLSNHNVQAGFVTHKPHIDPNGQPYPERSDIVPAQIYIQQTELKRIFIHSRYQIADILLGRVRSHDYLSSDPELAAREVIFYLWRVSEPVF